MNITQDFTNWLILLSKYQQVIKTNWVEKTLNYLLSAQSKNEGWGAFCREKPELFYSALVVRALSSFNISTSSYKQEQVAGYFIKQIGGKFDKLTLEEICNLITIINTKAETYKNDIEKLLSIAEEKTLNNQELYTEQLAKVLSTVSCNNLTRINTVLTKHLIERLLQLQNGNGGWPAVYQESNAKSTALVLDAFLEISKNNLITDLYLDFPISSKFETSVKTGRGFLENHLKEKGWENINKSSCIILKALVLKVLGKLPSVDYKMINEGIEIVFSHMNSDGSWGLKVGLFGDIETTASCFISLIEIGENIYVPANLAKAALEKVNQELSKVTEENNLLQNNFDKLFSERSRSIITERDKLLEENKKVIRQAQATEKEYQTLKSSNQRFELELLRLQKESFIYDKVNHLFATKTPISFRTRTAIALILISLFIAYKISPDFVVWMRGVLPLESEERK